MTLRLQYFSRLRDLQAPETVDLPENATVADLLHCLYGAVPGLRDWDRHLLVAVGDHYATRDVRLQPSDLVSLMPPVQGG
ncbi:MAG TPA: MoaD/ThiS family protein [Chthoniobacterales bacterium]